MPPGPPIPTPPWAPPSLRTDPSSSLCLCFKWTDLPLLGFPTKNPQDVGGTHLQKRTVGRRKAEKPGEAARWPVNPGAPARS